jgi:3-isopropylmalate/(R)-2-methylmalate dehydratase large subunit
VGAIGCIAFGIGTTDVFNSWFTKDVRVKVPESVKIVIRGRKQANVTAKDFILKILSLDYVRSGKALAKVMEYAGEAVEALSVDERATMTNMAAEIGGFTGIVAGQVVHFLERRGMSRAKPAMIRGLQSDPDAVRRGNRTGCGRDRADGGPGSPETASILSFTLPSRSNYLWRNRTAGRTKTWICTPVLSML